MHAFTSSYSYICLLAIAQLEFPSMWLCFESFLLIKWLDESNVHDVVPSKLVVPPDDLTIMAVDVGAKVKVMFNDQYYKAEVVDRG